MDHARMRQKMMQAAQSLQQRADSSVVFRPSAAGSCVARLWYDQRDVALNQREAEDPARAWPALQGQYNETLMGLLLGLAGAKVLLAPSEHELALIPGGEEPDDVFGAPPHVDGAIWWPDEINNDTGGWAYLEFKDMRAMAQIALVLKGLYEERGYWYQAVSYLMQGKYALRNNAKVKGPDQLNWLQLAQAYPDGLASTLFVSCAKDPSTTKMLLRSQTEPAKYEDNPDKMKPEQFVMQALKRSRRERLELLGGAEFYFEHVLKTDESVIAAWADIVAIPQALKSTTPPSTSHDPLLPAGDLDEECAWYCAHAEECKEYTTRQMLGQSTPSGEPLDPFRGLA